MKLYLVNKNPIISKLVALSVSKLGIEMEETQEIDSSLSAEIVLIDDESFEQELFDAYKAANSEAKFGLFYAKSSERLEGFNEYIQKPFLPTDLVKTLSKISGITSIDHHTSKKDNDNEMLEIEGMESLDNLGDELDLSGFDDLQLDDEPTMDSNTGDKPLDFGAEEGIEEAAEEASSTGDEPLDFGAEEEATENLDEQLDFGADDEESEDLNVLDKGDVKEIKDLLSSDEVPKQEDIPLDLDKELNVENSNAQEDLDFSDLQAELDKIEVAEEDKEEALDSQDETSNALSNLEVENIETSDEDSKEMGDSEFSFDTMEAGEGEIVEEEPQDLSEPMEQAIADTESKQDSVNEELNLEVMQDLGEELGGLSSDELQDSNFDTLDVSENLESQGDETKNDLDSLEGLNGMEDLNDSNTEFQEKQVAFDIGLEDELQGEESNPLEEQEDLEIPKKMEEELDSSLLEDIKAEEIESQVTKSQSDTAGLDEFDTLSVESMSEALGEPIAKAPNPSPIVPSASETDSKLPTNIQANSLESLIAALQALQTQNLKDLLSGATISINIQFPKRDED
ncbi:hypothetical protein [uncultured Helicobacter sp.]|uniref:hypothetical protein n=1 Tax=uncultured Helicobacter sp. TaxID=175537 RepID=UPI00260408FE|nr:hypothetical protein [uncultured Helicobacter sp.]